MLRTFAVFLAVALATASTARALPAPMSDQDLMDKSDLVAVVKIGSVSCTTVTKDQASGEDLPAYLAQAKVVEVKKGAAKPGDDIIITWRAVPKNIVGPWTVDYYPGEQVLTHLVKKSGGVSYGSTWWNAKGDDITAPPSKALPTESGQTFTPQQAPQPQTPL